MPQNFTVYIDLEDFPMTDNLLEQWITDVLEARAKTLGFHEAAIDVSAVAVYRGDDDDEY